jgi:hypothetical protein
MGQWTLASRRRQSLLACLARVRLQDASRAPERVLQAECSGALTRQLGFGIVQGEQLLRRLLFRLLR